MEQTPEIPPGRPPRRRFRDSKTGGSGQRTRRVNLRLSEQEYQELTAAAATVNITLAGYVARAALAAAVEQIPPDAFESLLVVMKLHGDVARVGNNVNQIARALNSGGAVPNPSIEAAVTELRALMQHLDNAALDLSVSMNAHRAKRAKARRNTTQPPATEDIGDQDDEAGTSEDWYEP